MDFAAYLRDQRIAVDDPYDQDNLREKLKISLGSIPTVFDNFYYVSGEKVYCHICGGHRHLKGVTGLMDDGTRILFGLKCAGDYFGKEVTKLHSADLRRRTRDAKASFRILEIKGELNQISDWLSSYRPLVLNCSQGWIEIKARHSVLFNEVTTHLARNGGRYVNRIIIETKSAELGTHRTFQDEIMGVVRSSEAVPFLTQFSQQLSLVDAFIGTIDTLKFIPTSESLANLNRMFMRMIRAAEEIDRCIAFTHDFFSEKNLAILSDWAERRRQEQLGGGDQITHRDVGRMFTRVMGSGFPLPARPLRDTILSIKSMSTLASETKLTDNQSESS